MASDETIITALRESASRGELVVVIGAGVSAALTNGGLPSWIGLIKHGLAHAQKMGKIDAGQHTRWQDTLASNDLDELLTAAEFMGRKLGAPKDSAYAIWLKELFETATASNAAMVNAVKILQAAKLPLCTLNYDKLLEQVTGLPAIGCADTPQVNNWMRRQENGIFHLHGVWDRPESCILGIRDYESTLKNDVRDLVQRTLASFKRLLFIGCGETFADPNFSALVAWLKKHIGASGLQHYALVKADEVAARHKDVNWHGFVQPLSYGSNYDDLPKFITTHFGDSTALPAPKSRKSTAKPTNEEHARLLASYRTFLLKDCGQMTIEGLRADMDTAQRRFDLERLFVPLSLHACPPDLPTHEQEREEKLQRWHKENEKSVSFGKVFRQNKKLALLALPGGGKTLLLKRLAVAYSDAIRREKSEDGLPKLDLMPVMIRCREWRTHIKLPILTLLQKLGDISGQANLSGLHEALLPLLKKGKVLLLVDGLDEIHDDAERTIFVEHLEAFLDQFNLIRVVITSREAGFSLVAPSLARFCARWRLAPLDPDSISALCHHWNALMVGDSPQSKEDAATLARQLILNSSLLRLASNPLLLTMLLVVKHGAGRLPIDRVGLYERAVEVLLDTWNIQGHAPLNLKEAVPQLACVAYQMMREGKQTATKAELLALLEQAREKVPRINLYAKDSPDEFLKRVELRSSLLLEAGHQLERGKMVAFYQFRHLTFQEYLTAVAAVEGHYFDRQENDNLLTPLSAHLITEEWKEVIPMAAVLARKQAEPLMAALVTEAKTLQHALITSNKSPKQKGSLDFHSPLPAAVARLIQCLTEEAEASSETLDAALQLIPLFAKSPYEHALWVPLCSGPYGNMLLHNAWNHISNMIWQTIPQLVSTYKLFAYWTRLPEYWRDETGQIALTQMLNSHEPEQIAYGLILINYLSYEMNGSLVENFIPLVEKHLFHECNTICLMAVNAWQALYQNISIAQLARTSETTMNRLLNLWLDTPNSPFNTSFSLLRLYGLARQEWQPHLTKAEVELVKAAAEVNKSDGIQQVISCIIAFHAKNIWPENELAARLAQIRLPNHPHRAYQQHAKTMLLQMGDVGKVWISKQGSRKKKRTPAF